MDICLHLGVHRTGTTTFQTVLQRNRDLLATQGVVGWGPRQLRKGLFAGLIKHPDFMNAEDMRVGNRSAGKVRAALRQLASSDTRHLIVSEENMIGTMTQNLDSRSLYSQARPRLQRFAPVFRDVVRVALTIRSYDTYWASAIAFKIRMGAGLPDEVALARLAAQQRRWRHVVGDVAKVFPNAELLVLPFEQTAHDPRYVLSVQTDTAFGSPFWTPPRPCNASLCPAELADILACEGDLKDARRVGSMVGGFAPFTQAQTRKLEADYAADLDWLAKGADGMATLITPFGETSDGLFDRRGSQDDRSHEERLGRPRDRRIAGASAGRSDVA